MHLVRGLQAKIIIAEIGNILAILAKKPGLTLWGTITLVSADDLKSKCSYVVRTNCPDQIYPKPWGKKSSLPDL